uniref:Uncharacterized protein n=1 Tax=Oryza meridionalis TaxID=40149 RepID=A0A0E0E173_9ORYZ
MVVSEATRRPRPPLLALLFGSVPADIIIDHSVTADVVELAYFEHGGILHYVIQKLQLSIY